MAEVEYYYEDGTKMTHAEVMMIIYHHGKEYLKNFKQVGIPTEDKD